MRQHLLPAVLVTICIGVASPVRAQETDCGLLCRINGYLATDHMAAAPNDAAPVAAPKGHRAHVAHKAAAKAAPKLADKGETPVTTAAEAKKPVAAKPPIAKGPPVLAARASPPPTKIATAAPHPAAARPRSAPLPAAPAPVVVEAQAAPLPAKQPVHHRSVATRSPVQASRAQTASVVIPGAAPAMPMGFQPFNVSFH